MWFDDATIYQIYPLGLCGAPLQNDGSDQTGEHRILRVLDWVEHIKNWAQPVCCLILCLTAMPTAMTPAIIIALIRALGPKRISRLSAKPCMKPASA